MDDQIDAAIARYIGMPMSALDGVLNDDTITVAEHIAVKIIMDAITDGGSSMKLLVERIGGTPINKNLNINRDEKSLSIMKGMEELLGGSRDDLVREIESSSEDSEDIKEEPIETHIEEPDDGLPPMGLMMPLKPSETPLNALQTVSDK